MKKILLVMIALVAVSGGLYAQFVEDALRYLAPNGTFGARTGALGTSYYGICDDNSSLLFNPAGLALIAKSEFNFGFGFDKSNAQSTIKSIETPLKSSDAYVTNMAMSSPFKSSAGNGSIAIAYNLETNFNRDYSIDFFNPGESFIQNNAKNGSPNSDNIAYYLWLCDSTMKTPIKDSLQQSSIIKETGGIHSLAGGTGLDISDVFSVGFSLICKFGDYNYNREFSEIDTKNIYKVNDEQNYTDLDFYKLDLNETISQSFFGVSAIVGLQAKISDFARAGFSIKLPTSYSIEEKYTQSAKVTYDDGSSRTPFETTGSNSYKITTPFAITAGFSAHVVGVTLSAGFEYIDASQLEFSEGPSELNAINTQILKTLTGRSSIGIGAEYMIPNSYVIVRGSYNLSTSPYINSTQDIATYNLGVGLLLAPNLRLDALVRLTETNDSIYYYGSDNANLKVSPMMMQIGMTYRY